MGDAPMSITASEHASLKNGCPDEASLHSNSSVSASFTESSADSGASAPMLEFSSVSFTYPGEAQPTIDKLSFSVKKGEFVCLIGPSGCGKSTIFRLVNKLITPQSGTIRADGTDISRQKGYCGYMPQNDLLFPWRSIAANIRLPLEIRGGLSNKEMDDRVSEALENVGLKGWGDKAPSELSGGMRQRAAFARTLMTGSDLLLLDEPFSALDYLTRLSMREWLLEQWERDSKTILFITHDVEEAVFLSGRVLAADTYPISSLRSVDIPAAYPRSRITLEEPGMTAIREQLIEMLRKEKP